MNFWISSGKSDRVSNVNGPPELSYGDWKYTAQFFSLFSLFERKCIPFGQTHSKRNFLLFCLLAFPLQSHAQKEHMNNKNLAGMKWKAYSLLIYWFNFVRVVNQKSWDGSYHWDIAIGDHTRGLPFVYCWLATTNTELPCAMTCPIYHKRIQRTNWTDE